MCVPPGNEGDFSGPYMCVIYIVCVGMYPQGTRGTRGTFGAILCKYIEIVFECVHPGNEGDLRDFRGTCVLIYITLLDCIAKSISVRFDKSHRLSNPCGDSV